MNTDNGALDFNAYINNEKLIGSVNEMEKRIKGFSDSTVKEGEKIDDVFQVTAENIRIQKEVIAQLETQVNNLNIEIAKLKPGQAQNQLKQEAAQVAAELKAEKDALKMLEDQVKSTEETQVSYRTQLRMLRDEMIAMEDAGKRDSAAYRDLQRRAGELRDAIGDAQQQMQVMADDERVFKGIVSTISGLTGAFSAAQGAVGLLAGENENLNKIMLKVQSLMAITIGLQQVAEMLNKDSYFSVVILTKGKELLAAAELKVAAAMGVSTVAARALLATLTFGLSIAITALIVLISKVTTKAAEARKEMEEFNKLVVDNAVKPLSMLEELSLAWTKLGSNIKEKEKFIQDNSDKFKELGVSITDVKEAENLFINSKDRFVESLILRAKAMATTELAAAKYKEALQKQLEMETQPAKIKKTEYTTDPETGRLMNTYDYEVENKKYNKLKADKERLEKEANDLFKKGAEFTEKEKEILKSIGLSSNKIVEGSITALEESISKLKDQYKNATSESERNRLLKQIKDKEKILDKMDKLSQKDNSKELLEKANKKAIDDYQQALEDELNSANSLLEMFSMIAEKKKELKGDGSVVDKGKKDALDKADKEIQQKAKEQTNKLLEEHATYLSAKLKLQEKYNEDMMLLQMRLDKATTASEKEAIQGAMKNRTDQFLKDKKLSGDSTYDSLVKDYQNFEQKKQAIIDDYEEKRRKAAEFGNDELIKTLNQAQNEELSKLAVDQLVKSADWTKLFGNLDQVSTSELIKLRDKVEEQFKDMNLTPDDLSALREKINEVTAQIEKRNPFLALSNAIKKYNEDKSSENFKDVFKDASASIAAVKDVFDQVTGSLDKLGIKTDEQTQQVLGDISGMLQGGADLAMGIATGNPLQIIQGSITLISNGIDLIAGSKDRKLERSIQRHAQLVDNLKTSYENLERAIDSALGTQKYDVQSQQIENLKKQQSEYWEMMKAENGKKKTDDAKVKEYLNAFNDAGAQILDIVQSIKEQLLGTDVKSVAQELGGAIIDAFAAGEDAAQAWGDKVKEIVGDVVKNLLIQKVVEEPVGNIINTYLGKWVDKDGKLLLSTDQIMQSATDMGGKLTDLGSSIEAILNSLPDSIKSYLTGSDTGQSPVTGAVQSVTEETAGVISGQLNAIRINQIESLAVIRNQLLALNRIADNTAYNINLTKLNDILLAIKALGSNDPLRAQGLG